MNKEKRKVPIKNILYMLSYIWEQVQYKDYTYLNNEDDFDSPNIFAKLFLENIKSVLKIGLYKEYNEKTEEIRGIRGKINFQETMNHMSIQNAKTVCQYDELEENNKINQIIKTTAYKLYKTENVKNDYKKQIKEILLYFNQVDIINITQESFNIIFNRNSQYTHNIIRICKLINDITMLSEEPGKYKFIDISDNEEIIRKIFEKFVVAFYKIQLKGKYSVTYQKELKWKIKDDIVPNMYVDIFLQNQKNTILIDTKYAEYIKDNEQGEPKLRSENLYQMFSYLNHVNINIESDLRGILLYPASYSQNEFSKKIPVEVVSDGKIKKAILQVRTVNLSNEWRDIERELVELIN